MSDTPRTDELAQKFSKTWNQFAYRSDEDIAKQFQNTDDALDLARQLERELAAALAESTIKESLTTAKPVAWMSTKMAGVVIAHQPEDFQRHPDRWQLLYAAQMLRPETEYICKCGLRVTPHRCKTDMEF